MRLIQPIAVSLGLGAVLVSSCQRHEDAKSAAPPLPVANVRVLTLEASTRNTTEEIVGTIRPKLQSRLEARVAGRIEEMRVAPGQSVKAGELLVRLQLQELGAKLEQAMAVRQQTAGDLQRYTVLLERGAATRAEFEAVQSRARVAEATAREAEAMLSHAEIKAPFDGVITRKLADVGDLAVPGKPLLELEDPTTLRVEASVGEELIGRIQLSQPLAVQVPGSSQSVSGKVIEIAPSADSTSRTFLVKLDLPPTPGLRAGTFTRVSVPVGDREELAVPQAAVTQRGQLEYVFVAADSRAQLRLVKTGKRHGSDVEVLAGVASGDRVIVSGVAQLQDGQPVQLQP